MSGASGRGAPAALRGPRAGAGDRVGARDRAGALGRAGVWLVLLSPAAVLPGALDRFTLPTVLVLALGVLLVGLGPDRGRLPVWLAGALAAGSGLLVLAALTSGTPWASLWGRWPRYEGLLVLPVYAGALWAGARALGPASTEGGVVLRRARAAVSVLSLAVAAVGVVEALGGRPLPTEATRPGSLLGNATDQGLVGMLCAVVLTPCAVRGVAAVRRLLRDRAVLRDPRDREPLLAAAGLLAALLTVALSGSRAALLGLVVSSLVLALLLGALRAGAPPHASSRRAPVTAGIRGALPALAVGAVGVGLALLTPLTRSRLGGQDALAAGTVDGRLLLWSETWDLIRSSPWAGSGPSTFLDAVVPFHGERWALEVGFVPPTDSPHSWPLQAAVAGGLPLAALAVAVAVLALLACRRRLMAAWRTARSAGAGAPEARTRAEHLAAVLALLVGYALAAATHFTTVGPVALVAFLAGGALALPPRPRTAGGGRDGDRSGRSSATARRARSLRGVVTAGACLWLLVLGGAVLAELAVRQGVERAAAGDPSGAQAAFDRAQALRPWDADTALLAAQAFGAAALEGDPSAAGPAAHWARAALHRVPDSVQAWSALAASEEIAGRPREALDVLDRLVGISPFDPEWRLRRGVAAAESGDLEAAESDFALAARYAPLSAEPWRNLETLFRLRGDAASAEDAARRAAALERAPSGD